MNLPLPSRHRRTALHAGKAPMHQQPRLCAPSKQAHSSNGKLAELSRRIACRDNARDTPWNAPSACARLAPPFRRDGTADSAMTLALEFVQLSLQIQDCSVFRREGSDGSLEILEGLEATRGDVELGDVASEDPGRRPRAACTGQASGELRATTAY